MGAYLWFNYFLSSILNQLFGVFLIYIYVSVVLFLVLVPPLEYNRIHCFIKSRSVL